MVSFLVIILMVLIAKILEEEEIEDLKEEQMNIHEEIMIHFQVIEEIMNDMGRGDTTKMNSLTEEIVLTEGKMPTLQIIVVVFVVDEVVLNQVEEEVVIATMEVTEPLKIEIMKQVGENHK